MAVSIPYPLINGVRHSFASIELKLNNQIFVGFKGINYKRTRTRAWARGNSPDPLGKTRGDNDYTADCELYLAEWNLFMSTCLSGGVLAAAGQVAGVIGGAIGGTIGNVASITAGVTGANNGYGDVLFTIDVQYTENGFDTIHDRLLGCTVDSTEASQTQSPDALTRKFDLMPVKILFAGANDLARPLSSTFGL